MSFYQQNTIALYSWFLLVMTCHIFLMAFHGSIFLNIKLGPTTTSSPRRRGRGLHNLDSSHDRIRFFWLAEVRNFTNIMIESATSHFLSQCWPDPWTHMCGTRGRWVKTPELYFIWSGCVCVLSIFAIVICSENLLLKNILCSCFFRAYSFITISTVVGGSDK